MTKHELELYRKCMQRKKRSITQREYEESHEFDTETNETSYDRE